MKEVEDGDRLRDPQEAPEWLQDLVGLYHLLVCGPTRYSKWNPSS